MTQKYNRLGQSPGIARYIIHSRSPFKESDDLDRFSSQATCHALTHPIALRSPRLPVVSIRLSAYSAESNHAGGCHDRRNACSPDHAIAPRRDGHGSR
jgi:hypothetical protein